MTIFKTLSSNTLTWYIFLLIQVPSNSSPECFVVSVQRKYTFFFFWGFVIGLIFLILSQMDFFLISFVDCSLPVHRNKINFYIDLAKLAYQFQQFILYIAKNFLHKILYRLCIKTVLVFFFQSASLYNFSCLIELARICSKMLNRNGKSILALFLILQEKHSDFHQPG